MPSYTNDPVTVSVAQGAAVSGASKTGEGIHGESQNENCAAVAGINSAGGGVYGESHGKGPGVFGKSQGGEGVHGETQSDIVAAIAGINSSGAGVYGESHGDGAGVVGISNGAGAGVYSECRGKGPGMFSKSQNWEGVHGETQSDVAAAIGAFQLNPNGTGPGVHAECKGKGIGVFGKSQSGEGIHGETQSDIVAAIAGYQMNPNGTGAGIYGESRGKGPAGFFKGDVFVTGDIRLLNADCAEDFTVGAQVLAEPGSVMVLGEEGALFPCLQAYDKRVAGVVSGAGDFKPGIVLDKQNTLENRSPIALIGKVYCKVDAAYGAVEIGDLLTTSPTLGHAMKAADPLKAFGAIIGKALRPLQEGQGLIPILVALQ